MTNYSLQCSTDVLHLLSVANVTTKKGMVNCPTVVNRAYLVGLTGYQPTTPALISDMNVVCSLP